MTVALLAAVDGGGEGWLYAAASRKEELGLPHVNDIHLAGIDAMRF